MAWNESGGGDKDPGEIAAITMTAPDLDEAIRKLQGQLSGMFGGGGGKEGRAAVCPAARLAYSWFWRSASMLLPGCIR